MGGHWSIYSSYLGVRCIAIWSIRNERFLCIIFVDRSLFGISRCVSFLFLSFFVSPSVWHMWWLLEMHLIPRPCVFSCYAMFLLCTCYSFHFKNSRDLIWYHSFFLPLKRFFRIWRGGLDGKGVAKFWRVGKIFSGL